MQSSMHLKIGFRESLLTFLPWQAVLARTPLIISRIADSKWIHGMSMQEVSLNISEFVITHLIPHLKHQDYHANFRHLVL